MSLTVNMQPIIDAVFEGDFDVARRELVALASVASKAGDGAAWLALELEVISAFIHLKTDAVDRSRAQLARVCARLDSGALPDAPPHLIHTTEQGGVVACCAGDLAAGLRLFEQGGTEIDRRFRNAPISELLRNSYHRALACMLSDRKKHARPSIDLAWHMSERVLERYPGHPERIAIRALRDAKDAAACRTLPFWFDLGTVPVPCHVR